MLKVFGEELVCLAKKHNNLVVLSSDCLDRAGIRLFDEIFGERHFNFGLGYANMVSAAAGFSARGYLPILLGPVSAMIMKGLSQIRNDLCLANLNVKLVGIDAGLSSEGEGAVCQVLEDIAILRALPNMKVVAPADSVQTLAFLREMIRDYGPTYLRLEQGFSNQIYPDACEFLGVDSLRVGNDLVLFSYGSILEDCLLAAKILEDKGVSAAVVNVAVIKPIFPENFQVYFGKFRNFIVVETHSVIGGLGDAIAEMVLSGQFGKLLKIGIDDRFGESGSKSVLRAKFGLSAKQIAERIANFVI